MWRRNLFAGKARGMGLADCRYGEQKTNPEREALKFLNVWGGTDHNPLGLSNDLGAWG